MVFTQWRAAAESWSRGAVTKPSFISSFIERPLSFPLFTPNVVSKLLSLSSVRYYPQSAHLKVGVHSPRQRCRDTSQGFFVWWQYLRLLVLSRFLLLITETASMRVRRATVLFGLIFSVARLSISFLLLSLPLSETALVGIESLVANVSEIRSITRIYREIDRRFLYQTLFFDIRFFSNSDRLYLKCSSYAV